MGRNEKNQLRQQMKEHHHLLKRSFQLNLVSTMSYLWMRRKKPSLLSSLVMLTPLSLFSICLLFAGKWKCHTIVRSKALLGSLVNQKNATCLAVTKVNKEDQVKLTKLQVMCKDQYNDNTEAIRAWGGGIMGLKTRVKLRKREEIKRAAKNVKASLT